MKSITLLLLALPLLALGCAEAQVAGRAAVIADLDLAVETIGLQPEGGLPLSVRLTVTNRAAEAVALTLPRAIVPEAQPPAGQGPTPFPLLALFLTDVAGHEESPVYTEPAGKAWPKAKAVALAPGGTWSGTYDLKDFYFWGPCGPDGGGTFTRYFWRGEKVIHLSAGLVFAEKEMLKSKPAAIACNFEQWLFQKAR